MMRSLTKAALVVVFLACLAAPGAAQRVLIETVTYTAMREAAAVYLHSAYLPIAPDFPPALLPGPVPLPGGEPISSAHVSDDESLAFLMSASRQPSLPHFVTAARTVPFEGLPRWDYILDAGWRIDAVTTLSAPGIGQRYLIAAESSMDGAESPRLRVTALDPAYPVRESRQAVFALPGRAVVLVTMPADGRVAALCEPTPIVHPDGAAALLHVHDVLTGDTVVEAAPLRGSAASLLNAHPTAMAWTPEQDHLFAIISGESLREAGSEPVSWLYALDPATGEPAAAPLELPGRAAADGLAPIAAVSLDARAEAACWLVTHSPRLRYGHLVRAMLREGRLVLDVQQPLGGAVAAPLLAVLDSMPGTAIVGVGERVESWPGGLFSGASRSFNQPVRALAAHGGRVLVGEGSRVHALALPTLMPMLSLPMPGGVVRGLHIIPRIGPLHDIDGDGLDLDGEQARGTSPLNPDTSGDGIHDGVDPNPTAPTPRLQIPKLIVLQSEAIGTEVRAVPIHSEVDGEALRIISVDSQEAPWLLASPRSWRGPGAFYLGVDRAWFGSFEQPTDARITVRLIDPLTNRDAYGSPAEIIVRVLPSRGGARRILWLVDGVANPSQLRAGSGAGFGEVSHLLAAAPLMFSHAVERTALDALSPYAVVVADGAAAARGAVLRQAMLDYVAQGGALLFLAGALGGEEGRTVARWLQPAGIRVLPGQTAAGAYAAEGAHPLADAWDDFDIQNGALLDAVEPAETLVPVPGAIPGAAFAVAQYGRGRIAVLAGPDPLTDTQMLRASNRRFAERLFAWLATAGIESRVHDEAARFAHGAVQPGLMAPGVGFPAADEPISFHGAPEIAAVEPAEGPMEGGTPVLIHGSNFGPAAAVHFGENPALDIRYLGPNTLRADTPPAAGLVAGSVPVRVVNPGVSLESVRQDAFRYTPRSVVRLTLESLGAGHGIYNHAVVLHADGGEAPIGLTAVRLHAEAPNGTIQWGSAARGAGASQGERIVTSVVDAHGDAFITVGRAQPGRASAGGEFAIMPLRVEEGVTEPIDISITWSRVLAPHGEPLDAETDSVLLDSP